MGWRLHGGMLDHQLISVALESPDVFHWQYLSLQDTNALVFRALLAALGVSGANDYDMNSLAVSNNLQAAC